MTFTKDSQLIVDYNRKTKVSSLSINQQVERVPLQEGHIRVRSSFAAINYKDIQSCLGNPGITRKYPHRPGSDVSGTVVESASEKFDVGDEVYTCTYPLGMNIPGTFGTMVDADARFFSRVPNELTLEKIMMYGTSGFTAGYSCLAALKDKGYDGQSILVAGATSSTGLFTTVLLNSMGIKPSVLVRANKQDDLSKLVSLDKVFYVEEWVNLKSFGLGSGQFDIIFDFLGGRLVHQLLSVLNQNGLYHAIGNALGSRCEISLLPFFERAVTLKGINSENCTEDRTEVWRFLDSLLEDETLIKINKKVNFSLLPAYLERILGGEPKEVRHLYIDF